MQQPAAITCTCAPSAPTQVMSQASATPRTKSERLCPSVRWERRPQFVREYVWADDDSQSMTTALITEVILPMPGPPVNELLNTENLSIVKTHPHLFHITTPIRVGRFCELLSTHPNRPLVESVIKGLSTSFWPWAVTVG